MVAEEAEIHRSQSGKRDGMKTKLKAPKITYKFQLAKLDGMVKEPVPNPEHDPRCEEIREWTLGEPNKIIYKREQ